MPPAKIDLIAARHSRHAVRRSDLLQGPVRRRRAGWCCSRSACSRRTRASSTCSAPCRRSSAEFPDVVYIVLGATHPERAARAGRSVPAQPGAAGQEEQGREERHLLQPVRRAGESEGVHRRGGLYITPYLNEAQITSGTLAYAFGSGKAVVSTPYWHAAELLAEDRGVLVPFGDAPAIAREVIGLLRDDTRRHAMRKNAYRLGREMIWSNVAQMYMRSFESRAAGSGGAVAKIARHQDARPASRGNCRS